METGQQHYDRTFPYFARPDVICEYSVDKNRKVRPGRSQAKYIIPYHEKTQTNFDLNQGRSTWINKDVKEEKLDVLLQWACTQAEEGECTAKKVFHEADIVCWRGLLTRIAVTPYCFRDAWRCVAVRVDDVIYLCEYETEDAKQRKENQSDRDLQFMYWGFKFEQYATTDQQGKPPDTSVPVDCREEFAVVARSRIALPGGQRVLRLAYGAEVDAIDENGCLVEMKTQRNALEGAFWKQKSCKWWLQSFLVGMDKIVVGYRDDNGIVHKVSAVTLQHLNRNGEWKGNVCFNFLSAVLAQIEQRLPPGSPDYGSCHIHYDPNTKRVHLGDAAKNETNFLTPGFIRHFNLPERLL